MKYETGQIQICQGASCFQAFHQWCQMARVRDADAPFFCFFIGAKLPKEKEALKLISSQPKMTFLSAKNEIPIAKNDTTVG